MEESDKICRVIHALSGSQVDMQRDLFFLRLKSFLKIITFAKLFLPVRKKKKKRKTSHLCYPISYNPVGDTLKIHNDDINFNNIKF